MLEEVSEEETERREAIGTFQVNTLNYTLRLELCGAPNTKHTLVVGSSTAQSPAASVHVFTLCLYTHVHLSFMSQASYASSLFTGNQKSS